jgi:hypothetical protein
VYLFSSAFISSITSYHFIHFIFLLHLLHILHLLLFTFFLHPFLFLHLGRNCRFLQGPGTDQAAVDIIRKGVLEGCDISVCLVSWDVIFPIFLSHLFTLTSHPSHPLFHSPYLILLLFPFPHQLSYTLTLFFLPSFSSTHPLSPSYFFLFFYLLFLFPSYLPSSSFTPSLTPSYNPSPFSPPVEL